MSDVDIARLLDETSLPALLPTLAWLTGDLSLLQREVRPDPALVREEQAGLTPEQQVEIRRIAHDVLVELRDGKRLIVDLDERPGLQPLMEHCIGRELDPDYAVLMEEELAATGEDLRAPAWRVDEVDAARTMRAIVIGAGMSGILAAHRLAQAGVSVVVLEKNDDVGGTWLENTYPGCRVDVANHLYSYSCAQKSDWVHHFSPQSALLDYFRDCATQFGIRDKIVFGAEVTSARWNSAGVNERSGWTVTCRVRGVDQVFTADVVVCAVGQLNQPKMPEIEGLEDFAGVSFHSARWSQEVDLTGKRVAVIGSAASSVQLLPWVAERAEHVVLYQRTPNWFVPVPHYHDEVPDGMRRLFDLLPSYAQWYRFWLFWRSSEGLLTACEVDPDWNGDTRAVGAHNRELRELLTMYLEFCFADRPDLLSKLVPDYAPAAKRLILDNGSWVTTVKRDNVEVVTDGIARVEAQGVVDTFGTLRDADVIVHATGFQAANFLVPMDIVGRDGRNLRDGWSGDARAYLGVTVPGFPNFFMLYGPNTNIVVNGSIIFFTECEVNYVISCLEHLVRTGKDSLEVRRERHEEYNRWIDEGNRSMVWGAATVNSWYRNEHGRSAQNWPYSLIEYWRRTRRVDPDDYDVLDSVASPIR